jgi:hypothetical protein
MSYEWWPNVCYHLSFISLLPPLRTDETQRASLSLARGRYWCSMRSRSKLLTYLHVQYLRLTCLTSQRSFTSSIPHHPISHRIWCVLRARERLHHDALTQHSLYTHTHTHTDFHHVQQIRRCRRQTHCRSRVWLCGAFDWLCTAWRVSSMTTRSRCTTTCLLTQQIDLCWLVAGVSVLSISTTMRLRLHAKMHRTLTWSTTLTLFVVTFESLHSTPRCHRRKCHSIPSS